MKEFNFVTDEEVNTFISNNDTEKCIKYLMTYRPDKTIMVVTNTSRQAKEFNITLGDTRNLATSIRMQPPIGLGFDYIFFDKLNFDCESEVYRELINYQHQALLCRQVEGTKVYYKND